MFVYFFHLIISLLNGFLHSTVCGTSLVAHDAVHDDDAIGPDQAAIGRDQDAYFRVKV